MMRSGDDRAMTGRGRWAAVVVAFLLAAQGVPMAAGEERIVGGGDASVRDYPWMVGLLLFDGSTPAPLAVCGGTVVAAHKVLTAAHCLRDPAVDPDNTLVIAGSDNLLDPTATTVSIDGYWVHPDYQTPVKDSHDVAVLTLSDEIRLDRYPALARPDQFPAGASAAVMGWGSTAYARPPSYARLKRVVVPLVAVADCARIYDSIGLEFDLTSMLCAGGDGGEGICSNDSGGALVADDTVIGVASFGRPGSCATFGFPDGYSNVAAQYEELRQQIES